MAEPIMTDKDVVALVRKEFERKVSDFCKVHGIEIDDKEKDEEDTVVPPDDDGPLGKRNPPQGKKPETLDISAIAKSVGLRVVHRDSGLEYYIREVYPVQKLIDLETPEGTRFQVDFEEIENDYKLG